MELLIDQKPSDISRVPEGKLGNHLMADAEENVPSPVTSTYSMFCIVGRCSWTMKSA